MCQASFVLRGYYQRHVHEHETQDIEMDWEKVKTTHESYSVQSKKIGISVFKRKLKDIIDCNTEDEESEED